MSQDRKPDEVLVPERLVGLPPSISQEARDFIIPMLNMMPPDLFVADRSRAEWAKLAKMAHDGQVAIQEANFPRAAFAGTIERQDWNGIPVYEIIPQSIPAAHREQAIYWVHGGAFWAGGGEAAAEAALPHAHFGGYRIFAIDYRMPLDHPYPAALDDAVSVYRQLLARYESSRIAIAGISAGGGLAASTILRARDEGLALPGAAILLTPEADLTESGDSFRTTVTPLWLTGINRLYANGHDLRHPYISPMFGDFTQGFPPTFIQSGTRDAFLSNSVILHRKLRQTGIVADLHVWEALPHGFFGSKSPESADLMREQLLFLDRHLA